MAIPCYLAMTAAEFQNCSSLPKKTAWLSCHFSPYGKGLSNVPEHLPPDSMLILDDASPIHGHDPALVLKQLTAAVGQHRCSCVLLDFQRPDVEDTAAMAAHLAKGLPCPVGVSPFYAKELSCAVLLPPAAPDVLLEDHIKPWAEREIWLELALDALGYRIRKDGASAFQPTVRPEAALFDDKLHCHYTVDIRQEHIDFTLFRTEQDINELVEQASAMGVTRCVGLWQELCNK